MRYRITHVTIILLALCLSLYAQDARIALFYNTDVQAVVFTTVDGGYILAGNGRNVAVISKGAIFHIEKNISGLSVHDTAQSYGVYNNLEFTGASAVNVFQVKPVLPSLPSIESDDNLSISLYNEALLLINRIGLEKYISGTVEAEGGSEAFPEYYKAQAVIARTFAVKNFHRHAHEGFNLCDGVHCQAFNGKSRMNDQIYTSTSDTRNEILVDRTGKPVITAYHACCGGITASASVEWNRALPQLMPVIDPFCSESKHRNWTKTILLKEWTAYLGKTGYGIVSDNLYKLSDPGRQKYLDDKNKRLPLAEIRKDFQLKSSYFYVTAEGEQIAFHGHGYGHGLGLCQEGGMEMARMGYTYVDILMFYYTGLRMATIEETIIDEDDQ